jgi:hypothetical protein
MISRNAHADDLQAGLVVFELGGATEHLQRLQT